MRYDILNFEKCLAKKWGPPFGNFAKFELFFGAHYFSYSADWMSYMMYGDIMVTSSIFFSANSSVLRPKTKNPN